MNFLCHALAGCFAAALCLTAPRSTIGADATDVPDSAAAELEQIQAADDAAQLQVDQWVRQGNKDRAGGSALPELQSRITKRFEPVRKAYADFVSRHPKNPSGMLAYGNFLNAREDERGAQEQWEHALQFDPGNAALYNNLAGRYGESGPVNRAFEYSEKAIKLNPNEPVYYHNFGDLLYVLRKPATTFYGITEQQVFSRCLLLYSNALRLDPLNYSFARDFAQTYYSLKPLPTDVALRAWTNVLSIARDQDDRQEVYLHLARIQMLGGRFEQARLQLNQVTNLASAAAKASLLKGIEQRQALADPNTANQRHP